MHPVTLRYRAHIDGLRAVAVLAVLGFHAFPKCVPGGFLGVDIFFVISGFLISSILYAEFGAAGAGGIGVVRDFYSRRIRRIFPALVVVLAACLAIGYLVLLPSELAKLSVNIVASAGFCLNFLLARDTGYFSADSASNPLLHLWSLGVEEQFYLIWPLAIWAAVRCRVRVLPVAVFLASASYFWNGHRFDDEAAAAFFLPQMRLWELLIGAIAAAIHPLVPRACDGPAPPGKGRAVLDGFLSNGLPLVGITLIGASLAIVHGKMGLPNAWSLLPTVGAACVVCSRESAWVNRWVLCRPALVRIGLISYPLYLWHWPLLSYSHIALENPDSVLVKLGVLLVSLVLAWLTYAAVEMPLRRRPGPARTTALLAGAMTAVICLGVYTKVRAGFPTRFPPLMQQISEWKYDPSGPYRQGTFFLMGQQDASDFKIDPGEILAGKPTLFLWGDSHAAALYPGLSSLYGRDFNIVERAVGVTPPFMSDRFNPGNAQHISRYVLETIRRTRPEYVLLEADWERYEWEHVEETIVALKAGGVRHVVLVGPVPHWIGSLPQQLFNYIRKHRREPVPVRMNQGLSPDALRIDTLMAAMAARLQVEYISPCSLLRNQDGFLVRTGDTADSLTAYDNSHLTASGSKYLVSRFPKF